MLVVGQGPVGLMALQAVRLRGAAQIVTADLDAWRLDRSSALGADRAVPVDGSLDVLDGGFDVAIDAVGTPHTANSCVDLVRHNGLVVLLGTHHVDTSVAFDLITWEKKGLRIHTSAEPTDAARAESIAITERLVCSPRRLIRLDELLTDVYPLTKLPAAVERLSHSSVLVPSADQPRRPGPPSRTLKLAIQS